MTLKKFAGFNKADYYILCWVLYYLQGILYPQGIISQIFMILCVSSSIYYALKVLKIKRKSKYFHGLTLLLSLFTLYGVVLMLEGSDIYYKGMGVSISSYVFLQQIYISLLPIYAFYYFAYTDNLSEERLRMWGIVFFISCTLTFYKMQQEVLQRLIEMGSERTEDTNNAGYYFLSLFPVLVIYKGKPIVQYVGLMVIIAYLLIGMKRGAIALGGLCAVLFLYENLKKSSTKMKIIMGIFSFVVVFFAYRLIEQLMDNSDFFVERLQSTKDNNSSGRDELFSFFWNHFIHADLFHFIFGYGANGSAMLFINGAHNDWLEIATNEGLIGLVIYFVYWKGFYQVWKTLCLPEAKMAIGLIVIIFFARTLFSQSYGAMTYQVTSVLGYYLAIDFKAKMKQIVI